MRFVVVLLTLLCCALAQNNSVQRLNANELAAFFQNPVKEVVVLGLPSGALEGVLLEGLKQRRFSVAMLLGKERVAEGRRWGQAGVRVGYVNGQLTAGIVVANKTLVLWPQSDGWLIMDRPEIAQKLEQLWRTITPRDR